MTNIETFRAYCLNKKGVTESFPFDENTLVFKVLNKMFALTNLSRLPFQVNLKCDPERAITLRENYPDHIFPGYHMSKKHWNTVFGDQGLDDSLIAALTDHSYELVVSKMTKKQQEVLKEIKG